MKDIKKFMGLILVSLAIIFGVLVMVDQYQLFKALGDLSFENRYAAGSSVTVILYLLTNVLLLVVPIINLFLLIFNKREPYKAIVKCAIVIIAKFLFIIFADIIVLLIIGVPGEAWKNYLFGGDSLAFVRILIFGAGLLCVELSGMKSLEGKMARAVLITVGAGLTIFGLIFYYAKGTEMNALQVLGLVSAIACLGGLVVYSFLPQTREY